MTVPPNGVRIRTRSDGLSARSIVRNLSVRDAQEPQPIARRVEGGFRGSTCAWRGCVPQSFELLSRLNQVLMRGVHLRAVEGRDHLSALHPLARRAHVQAVYSSPDPSGDRP